MVIKERRKTHEQQIERQKEALLSEWDRNLRLHNLFDRLHPTGRGNSQTRRQKQLGLGGHRGHSAAGRRL